MMASPIFLESYLNKCCSLKAVKAFVVEALFNARSGQESFLATGNRVIQCCQLIVGLLVTKPANPLNDSVLRE